MQKILIVDDDEELRTNLSELLNEVGYTTVEAATGMDALEKIAGEEFDIALLDLMMPKMSGIDVLTEFRKSRPKMKVIMITAFATIEDAVEAIKKGACDYIAKPFKIPNLLMTIKKALEDAKFEENIERLKLDYALQSLSNSIRRGIIKLLFDRPGMRLMEITRELGIEDHTKVVFHLKILRELGVIEQEKEKSYHLTAEGENIISILKVLTGYLAAE